MLRAQAAAVGAPLGWSTAALLDGHRGALGFVAAAAAVELVLVARAAILAERRCQRALEVIIEGRGDLPIDAVRRQCARLLEPSRRRRLAATLDEICHEAVHPFARSARVRPIFDVRAVAETASELAAVARLLRDDNARLRGIAMAQRLIADGTSALYGDNRELLRQELHRIHYHLVDRS